MILIIIFYLFIGVLVARIEFWLNSSEEVEFFDFLMVFFYPLIWGIGSEKVYKFLKKK